MRNVSGVTAGVQREGRTTVFHVPAPLSAYAEGPLAMVEASGYRRLQVLARNGPRSREAADFLGRGWSGGQAGACAGRNSEPGPFPTA